LTFRVDRNSVCIIIHDHLPSPIPSHHELQHHPWPAAGELRVSGFRFVLQTCRLTQPDYIRTAGLSTSRLSIPRPARRNSEPGLPSPLLPKPAQWDWWECLPTYSEDGSTSILILCSDLTPSGEDKKLSNLLSASMHADLSICSLSSGWAGWHVCMYYLLPPFGVLDSVTRWVQTDTKLLVTYRYDP